MRWWRWESTPLKAAGASKEDAAMGTSEYVVDTLRKDGEFLLR